MKFFIRYVLRIEPCYTSPPLINGSAFHAGKASFYKTGSEKKALRTCRSEIKGRREEFESIDIYDTILKRCPTLLQYWIYQFGFNDLERFNFLAIEEELSLSVPNTSFIFTVRPDTVAQEKTGEKNIYILETKTSSFSINNTEIGVYYGDQATAYTWAVQTAYKLTVDGVIPDIAYWNSRAVRESNISCVRGSIIQRSPQRIAQWLSSLAQLQTEISQKLEAYKNNYDPYMLFPRNTFYCNAYFKPCEFADICDNNLSNIKRLPPSLKRNKSRIKPTLNTFINDSLSGVL